MGYHVVLRRNGAKVGHFGPFSTKKQAIAQGQVLADDAARDVVVSVEPQRKKATTKKKRTNTRRSNPKRGTFKAQEYKYYKLGGRRPAKYLVEGRNSLDSLSDKGKKKYVTKEDAKEAVGYSLTSSYAWLNNKERQEARREGRKRRGSQRKAPQTKAAKPAAKKTTKKKGSQQRLFRNNSDDWIKREGKLGGPGYAERPVRTRHMLLNRSVKGYGYRSTLGSLQVLLLNSAMGNKDRKVIEADKKWLMKKYGGEGSFSKTRSNPASKATLKRIALANKWIEFARKHNITGTGYFGSTWPVSIKYTHLIRVSPKANVAAVKYTDGREKHSEMYSLNDSDRVGDLRYEISNYIIKAIKNGAKDEGVTIPASLR